MKDANKTKEQLVKELGEMRKRIAELEASELELKGVGRQLRYMSKVFTDSIDPIIIEDMSGNIIDMNDGAERTYGWKRKELIGKPIKTIVPPERYEQAAELLARCKAGEEVRNVEGLRCDKSGRVFPVLITLSLLTDEEGMPTAIASIVQGITELKRAEEELQKHQEHLERLVEERSAKLRISNEQLGQEIVERKQAEEHIRRLYLVLSAIRNVNQLITREKDSERLIQQACELLLEHRSYDAACVLLADSDGNFISAASSGLEDKASLIIDQMKQGQYPQCVQETLIQGQSFIAYEDVSHHEGCDVSTSFSGKGCLASRLEHEGKVYGAIWVTAVPEVVLDKEEQSLFLELVTDLSYALAGIETENMRKQAEEKTRQVKERLQLQIGRMPIGLIVWDTEFRVQSWNPVAEKIFGFTQEEALGKHPYDIIVPSEAQPHVDDIWRRLLEGDETANSVNENITKDSRTIICQWSNTPLKEADGTVLGILSMVQDITERKNADERIAHLTSVLRALRNVNQLITKERDREILIQKSCDLLIERRSYYKSWILLLDKKGKPESLAHAGFEEDIKAFLEQMRAGNYPQCVKELLAQKEPIIVLDQPGEHHKDCVQTGIHSTGVVLRGKLEHEGKLYGVLGVSVSVKAIDDEEERSLFLEMCGDIAFALANIEREEERKQMEEILQFHGEILRNMGEGVQVTRTSDQVIVHTNPRFEEMFGYGQGELLGKHVSVLNAHGEQTPQKVAEEIIKSLEESGAWYGEIHNIRKDGTMFWCQVNVSMFEHPAHGAVWIAVHQDITERKEAEKKARELQVLREVDILRSQLLSNVSHELRTPLASIKGFTSTLLRTDTKWSEEEQRDFLETIDQESDRLTRIISDLLDMSRLDAGALKLDRDNYHIPEILESIDSRLAGIAKCHRLEKLVPSELPPVFADEMRIGQVLTNLVENATKFSPEGSEITIEAKLAGDEIIVSVTDRGEGIPSQLIDKLFDRFYQTESVVAGRKSGTGLGLSISQGIIQTHGGRIWVESKLGKGSKFSFSLPVAKRENQNA